MSRREQGNAISRDGTQKGWQGYHAHVLTSTRKLGRESFGDKAEIELSDTKRKSLGLGDGASEIERIRELWEVAANRHLEQANQAQRIDRRSLKDQGIDREPTVHLGAGVTALERDGIPSRLGDINRQVVAEHRMEREPFQRSAGDDRPLTPDEIRIIHEIVDEALAKIYRQRDQRVQRVLAKAQVREQRREKAYQGVQERSPVPPRGFVDSVQQKGHQQAVLAWQVAKEAAAKLVEQARKLGQRLLEASGIKQLIDWSRETLKRQQPELVERRDEAARQSEGSAQTRQPAKGGQLEREAPERVPFWEQPGVDPKTFVETKGRVDRQAEPPSPPLATPPKDIKTQAAEGVAAFRAKREKERQIKPDKTVAEQMAERLRAQIEAEHKAAEQKRQAEQERIRDRGKDRGGPSRGR